MCRLQVDVKASCAGLEVAPRCLIILPHSKIIVLCYPRRCLVILHYSKSLVICYPCRCSVSAPHTRLWVYIIAITCLWCTWDPYTSPWAFTMSPCSTTTSTVVCCCIGLCCITALCCCISWPAPRGGALCPGHHLNQVCSGLHQRGGGLSVGLLHQLVCGLLVVICLL